MYRLISFVDEERQNYVFPKTDAQVLWSITTVEILEGHVFCKYNFYGKTIKLILRKEAAPSFAMRKALLTGDEETD